jgi:hypothetical protein
MAVAAGFLILMLLLHILLIYDIYIFYMSASELRLCTITSPCQYTECVFTLHSVASSFCVSFPGLDWQALGDPKMLCAGVPKPP